MTRKEEIEGVANARAQKFYDKLIKKDVSESYARICKNVAFSCMRKGAEWADSTAWKPADGDNLPEIDREVIALVEEIGYYKVVYAHRPPEYWDGRNILTDEVTRNYPKRYDKGEWNQPNVKWWLDLELPKMEE